MQGLSGHREPHWTDSIQLISCGLQQVCIIVQKLAHQNGQTRQIEETVEVDRDRRWRTKQWITVDQRTEGCGHYRKNDRIEIKQQNRTMSGIRKCNSRVGYKEVIMRQKEKEKKERKSLNSVKVKDFSSSITNRCHLCAISALLLYLHYAFAHLLNVM